MTHLRDFSRSDANQGEGTYEFTGVDAALQSNTTEELFMMICSEKMLSSPNLLHCLLGNGSNLQFGASTLIQMTQTPNVMK